MTTDLADELRPETWLRRRGRIWFFSGSAYLFSAFFVLMPLTVLPGSSGARSAHRGVGGFVGVALFCLVVAVLGLIFARRLGRAGLWIAGDGIVVRNPVRITRVPLDDVDRFVAGVAGGGNRRVCPILTRRRGPSVGIWALGREGFIWQMKQQTRTIAPLCDGLNDVLRSVRGSTV